MKHYLFVCHWKTIETSGPNKGFSKDCKEAWDIYAPNAEAAKCRLAEVLKISVDLLDKKNWDCFILASGVSYTVADNLPVA